jgi:DNA-binding NarL/FixJ family response regulator
MGRQVNAQPSFVLFEPLRLAVLRAAPIDDAANRTAAVVLAERLMKGGDYVQAARVAIRGHQWRTASQALRVACARGQIPFADVLAGQFASVPYREAEADSFVAFCVAMAAHETLLPDARNSLLGFSVSEAGVLGEEDERDLAPSRAVRTDLMEERELWRALTTLLALRALDDWRALGGVANNAARVIASTSKRVLAGVGALHGYLSSQIELINALLGKPENSSVEDQLRLVSASTELDRSGVIGRFALADAIRGHVSDARTLLAELDSEPGAVMSGFERIARVVVALEERDHRRVSELLDAPSASASERDGSEVREIRDYVRARLAYAQNGDLRARELMGRVAAQAVVPWVVAESHTFRVERYLAENHLVQADAAIAEIQCGPYARWDTSRIALAKSRFAHSHLEASLRIVEAIWVSDRSSARHRARALAVGAACALQQGRSDVADALMGDLDWFHEKSGLAEMYDDLPEGALEDAGGEGRRSRPPLSASSQRVALTKRERAVLIALGDKASADEIAATMHVSKNTIKTQMRRIYAKLGVHSRHDALRTAIDEGLL